MSISSKKASVDVSGERAVQSSTETDNNECINNPVIYFIRLLSTQTIMFLRRREMKPPRSKLKYKINKLHDRAKQGGAINFYLILKLILMISFYFEGENHHKFNFFLMIIFFTFLIIISSG